MHKLIITLVLFSGLLCLPAEAKEPILRDDAPKRYRVVKGDTLWGISAHFLKTPWRWPEIWEMNRKQIKNPHLIYPGNIIVLDRSGKRPRLRLEKTSKLETVTLSPSMEIEDIHAGAIPSIPMSAIEPFLNPSLIGGEESLANAHKIVGAADSRIILGTGDRIYASGITRETPLRWHIFRPGKDLVDPESGENLGREIEYLGKAKVVAYSDPAALEIISTAKEIMPDDLLFPVPPEQSFNYVPHAPEHDISGRIISMYNSISSAGTFNIVTINRGSRNGLEIGNVLAIHNKEIIRRQGDKVETLSERSALLFVFRVFEKASYGLIVQASHPVSILDVVTNP